MSQDLKLPFTLKTKGTQNSPVKSNLSNTDGKLDGPEVQSQTNSFQSYYKEIQFLGRAFSTVFNKIYHFYLKKFLERNKWQKTRLLCENI